MIEFSAKVAWQIDPHSAPVQRSFVHDVGLYRRNEQVGEEADQAEAPEVEDDQGQGGDVGGEGDEQAVLQQAARDAARASERGVGCVLLRARRRQSRWCLPSQQTAKAGYEALEAGGDGGREKDEAGGGRAGELEAHVPEGERIGQRHGPAGGSQADERSAAPVEGHGPHKETAHERCAHHRGVAADEQGVERNADQRGVDGTPPAQDAGE